MKAAPYHSNDKAQREKQRALAVAALAQTSCLITSITQTGKCDPIYFKHCMHALLNDDYTQDSYFSLGNTQAKRLLQGQDINHAKQIVKYAAAMLAVEKKLAKQPKTLQHIGNGMLRIHKQVQFFNDPCHENIIAAIAHLYGETVSTIKPRIIIRGKPEHLKQSRNTEQIRCLLLSGIRAAWIWRINGGHPFRFIIGRRKLIHSLQKLSGHTSL